MRKLVTSADVVVKLDVKKPQLWYRYFALDDTDDMYIVMPDSRILFYDLYTGRWKKSLYYEREDLERYGEFLGYC